ncbi:MAG: Putative fluoride ion transporter CrcB [Alphaproteobacteria bacterium]|nr:MAG: Putative fluoride ion transporter CrcB [Alphaproteobacteria bacterium]
MSGQAIIWVALGGALGAVGRYLVGLVLKTASGFPWATMSVNILGSLLMGLVIGWLSRQNGGSDALRLFVAVGILGGFTTFSAFSMDLFTLLERRDIAATMLYLGGSLIGGLAAFIIGFMALRAA